MKVLQINSAVGGGGAERIAITLNEGLRRAGFDSLLLVGKKNTDAEDVVEFEQHGKSSPFERSVDWLAKSALDPLAGQIRGAGFLANLLREHCAPQRLLDHLRGRESFHYPHTLPSIQNLKHEPDIIHCHNLHGGYFDLRVLATLSRQFLTFVTLHDEWLLTGHCAYSLGCEKWRQGCGACPDLSIYPALLIDGTRGNAERKETIYQQSRLFISAPSKWLVDRARQSILAHAAEDFCVIPNGVDLKILQPRSKVDCRDKLDIPREDLVVCFAAKAADTNKFKDYATVFNAGRRIGQLATEKSITLLVLGGHQGTKKEANVTVRGLGYVSDQNKMVDAYCSADFYLHAAHADNFPTTILEALACGVPVVATDVGGISEQIESCLTDLGSLDPSQLHQATGALVPPQNSDAMAKAVFDIMLHPSAQKNLAENARRVAVERFDTNTQVQNTIDWYRSKMPNGGETS